MVADFHVIPRLRAWPTAGSWWRLSLEPSYLAMRGNEKLLSLVINTMEVRSSTLERLTFESSSVGGYLRPAWCRGWGWPMRKVGMIPPHTTWKLRQVSISCPWPLASQVCSQGSTLLLGTQHLTDPSAKSGEGFSTQLSPQCEQSRLVSFCWWLSDAPSLLFMLLQL